MKNFCITLICLSIIILTMAFGVDSPKANEEYLRIHIRARSDSREDQATKYAVRDEVIVFLTPIIAACDGKEEVERALKNSESQIEEVCERVIKSLGYTYGATAKVGQENFPTRVYGDLTLEEGYYDALIIELGGGEGANWWCVVYPPLCFTGEKGGDFRYKSKIAEMIEKWRANK